MKLGDLQEGMYIRYIPAFREYTQKISKILKIENRILDMVYYLDNVKNGKEYVSSSYFDDVLKASHNIIDLIEVGDYVNGKLVTDIQIHCCDGIDEEDGSKCLFFKNEVYGIYNQDIKTILTKEQFENNCFRKEN